MRTVAIVQARITGGTRFGGPKVLAMLGKKTVLQRTVERLRQANLDEVVVAIPDTTGNDVLATYVLDSGCALVRGPEDDVLARYAIAACESKADIVVRATADCPLVDAGIVNGLLKLRDDYGADYACNNMERTFAHGLDVEAFTVEALFEANAKAIEREHPTVWIRDHIEYERVNMTAPKQPRPSLDHVMRKARLTLDYPEDFVLLNAIFAMLDPYDEHYVTIADVLELLERRPVMMKVNSHCAQKWNAAQRAAGLPA